MDNQQLTSQSAPTSPTPQEQSPSKRSTTPWIVLSLLLLATFLTSLAYFLLPTFLTKDKTPIVADDQTVSPQEVEKWQTYQNTKYQYSFFYPETWEITNTDSDQKNFELHYNGGPDIGIITISYFTPEERRKLKPLYCETADNPARCHRYELTQKSSALLDRMTSENVASDKADALVSLPNGGALRIQVTDSNTTSYDTVIIVIDTLSFPGEQRKYGMQICPENAGTWPTNEEYVTYKSVQIPTRDIDMNWANHICPQQLGQ